jgi:hypothetical protein
MDKDIVKRAMEMSGNGQSLAQVAKKLGVNRKELRRGISEYDGFGEECEVAVIVPAAENLGSTAFNLLAHLFKAIEKKTNDPFASIGELSTASALCYKIYREENAGGNANDDNDPVKRLFGDEVNNG